MDNVRLIENGSTGEIHGGMPMMNIIRNYYASNEVKGGGGGGGGGGGSSQQFENYVVPMGLIVENRSSVIHKMAMMNEGGRDVVSDSIFDRLFEKMIK